MDPITLIGAYPPPYGGVSVHIKRLKRFLEAHGLEVSVLADPGSGENGRGINARRLGPVWYADRFLRDRPGLLHFHTSGLGSARLLPLALLALRGRPVVVTLHSLRDRPSGILPGVLRLALRSFRRVICVGPEIHEQLLDLGLRSDRLTIIPSYLPPDLDDAERKRIAPEVHRFISDHDPVLTASAYRLIFFNGEDLYGLDLCVDLCRSLIEEYPRLGLVFALPEIGDESYFASIKRRIIESGLEGHFCFSRSPSEYWPIIERASVLIRPTNTDSYGVSVMEAMSLAVPAIASDVCERAPGTILFRRRDPASLLQATREVLGNLEDHGRRLAGDRPAGRGAAEQILTVYRDVLDAG